MKNIDINLVTAPTVQMPLLPHRLHKTLIIIALGLFLTLMILVAGGILPLVRGISQGVLATLSTSLR